MCEYKTTFAALNVCGISNKKDSSVCVFHKEIAKYNYIPYVDISSLSIEKNEYFDETDVNRIHYKKSILKICSLIYTKILNLKLLFPNAVSFSGKSTLVEKKLSIDLTDIETTTKNINSFLSNTKKYFSLNELTKMIVAVRSILLQLEGVLKNSSNLETKYGIQVYNYDNNALIYIFCNSVLAFLFRLLSNINTKNKEISELLKQMVLLGKSNNIVLSKQKNVGNSVEFCLFCIPRGKGSCVSCPNFAVENSLCEEHMNKEEESENEEEYEEENLIYGIGSKMYKERKIPNSDSESETESEN